MRFFGFAPASSSTILCCHCSLPGPLIFPRGYAFNIQMLRRLFTPTLNVLSIKRTGPLELTTRCECTKREARKCHAVRPPSPPPTFSPSTARCPPAVRHRVCIIVSVAVSVAVSAGGPWRCNSRPSRPSEPSTTQPSPSRFGVPSTLTLSPVPLTSCACYDVEDLWGKWRCSRQANQILLSFARKAFVAAAAQSIAQPAPFLLARCPSAPAEHGLSISALWHYFPTVLPQGVSILEVNPQTRKFKSHVDKWDSIQNNDYFSFEGVADLIRQMLQFDRTPDLEQPEYTLLTRRANYEVRKLHYTA